MIRIPGFTSLYNTDGYKPGHQAMLAPGTTRLYGTWIPRSTKHAPKGINKIVSATQQVAIMWLHEEFEQNFFHVDKEEAMQFGRDMSKYLNLPYDYSHFEKLFDLGYLPFEVQSLPEGIETLPNIPHMTFINTVNGFAWLTLYLETFISSLAWKGPTSASIALRYRRNVEEWVMKTDPDNKELIPWLCHDFSARGLDPYSQITSGLGHAFSFLGSDTLPVIPTSRFFYGVGKDEMPIGSVNASEHSVSTTKIFTVGEKQMIIDWLEKIPEGIFSMVCDTFSTWEFINYLNDPIIRDLVINRKGKLVVRPDSGDPVDIICGLNTGLNTDEYVHWEESFDEIGRMVGAKSISEFKGVIELLGDIFGYTVNEQGYKVLPPYIGAIYGDSITLERQIQIYERLAAKGWAATNIVLGVGSFTYQYNTRDTFGFAAKGAWFEVEERTRSENMGDAFVKKGYDIYKDPITDDGTKKSLKGFQFVLIDDGEYEVISGVSEEKAYSEDNLLKTIYKNGEYFNQVTLREVRERINKLV